MIDAGIWGQLPSLINAGIFADNQGLCAFIGSCSYPFPGGLVGAGQTIICTENVTVPAGGGKIAALGDFNYVPGVGDDLCNGCHEMRFQVDGVTAVSFILSNPTGNQTYIRENGTQFAISAGVHTIGLIYFAQTTGIGNDIINSAALQVSLCPP